MLLESLKKELMTTFPNVEVARIFFMKQNIKLEEQHGFIPENTHFAEGGCSDEINEPEYLLMEQYWGERFKFGGLAGYCHGGKTSFEAVSHHVPEISGVKNLLFLTGPHIGYYKGEWGKVSREGQSELTSSCGSLAATLQANSQNTLHQSADPLDLQQQTIEKILTPYFNECSGHSQIPSLLDATKFLMRQIDLDIQTIVNGLATRFNGQIAVITGITINTDMGNFFSPSLVDVLKPS